MVRRKRQPSQPKEYTARPKQARKSKRPIIGQRTAKHCRAEFNLRGLSNEVLFFDIADDMSYFDGERSDPRETENALVEQIEGSTDNDSAELGLRERQLEFLRWAMTQITDRQAQAVGLYYYGASQCTGAECMGITQPTFNEAIFGKDGKGGAIKRLRKLAAKHPIAQT